MRTIKDNRGRVLGWLNDAPDKIYAHSHQGYTLGWFDKKLNRTVDKNSRLVSRGTDATMALIFANSPQISSEKAGVGPVVM